MNLRQPVTPRMALVIILVCAYAVLLLAIITMSRREERLVEQTAAAEAAAAQLSSDVQNSAPALRANLTAAKARLAALDARVPRDIQVGVFERVAQDAQANGISDFRYQRKNDYQETMQAGVYKVYRFTIAGRGSQDKVAAFLDSLQKDSGQTMLIENVTVTATGVEWQMSADIIVYTWGG